MTRPSWLSVAPSWLRYSGSRKKAARFVKKRKLPAAAVRKAGVRIVRSLRGTARGPAGP